MPPAVAAEVVMRGTFALVVVAGVAAAAAWSLVRQAGEDAPVPEPGDPVLRDPPAPDAPVRDLADPVTPAPTAMDAASVAREYLSRPATGTSDAGARARALEAAGRLVADAGLGTSRAAIEARVLARRVYASVYDNEAATAAERTLAYDRSRDLFESVIRGNGAPADLVLRHAVEPGQSVWALAKGTWKRAGATSAPGFVLWVNGVTDARKVRAGQILKVPLEPLAILVRKRAFELTVTLGGAPVERFTVAVGADARTPVGVFQAKDCLKNPDWYMNGRKIPFGSPDHIIGTRWIGLAGGPEADGIGVHGTTDDASIGTAASQGCIRMRNADVERIFEWISIGTRVEIRD